MLNSIAMALSRFLRLTQGYRGGNSSVIKLSRSPSVLYFSVPSKLFPINQVSGLIFYTPSESLVYIIFGGSL